MRIAPMLIVFWIFAATIALFTQNLAHTYTGEPYQEGGNSTSSDPTWSIITNPVDYFQNQLTGKFLAAIGTAGAVLIGVYIFTKSDMVLLFGMLAVFMPLIIIPAGTIWRWVQPAFRDIMCASLAADQLCYQSYFISSILVGIPVFLYVMAVFEWWTARPLTR